MSAELAHQKADKYLCMALQRKVRIRLHPSMALQAEICTECSNIKRKDKPFFLNYVHKSSHSRYF